MRGALRAAENLDHRLVARQRADEPPAHRDAIEHGHTPDAEWLQAVGREDGLFPTLNAADWATLPAVGG